MATIKEIQVLRGASIDWYLDIKSDGVATDITGATCEVLESDIPIADISFALADAVNGRTRFQIGKDITLALEKAKYNVRLRVSLSDGVTGIAFPRFRIDMQ